MLKRDIRIGDKTPSKISLGKDEPTSICLGDKLIWGGVDDTVDVTVYVDNPEVFNEENSYAVIIIGDKSVSIDRNHNGPFQFKTTLENNRVVTNYLSHSSNLSDDVEIIVNGSVGAAYLGTVGFIYGFRIGNNEVHIKFKEVPKEQYIDVTLNIGCKDFFYKESGYVDIRIGDNFTTVNHNSLGPFKFKIKNNVKSLEVSFEVYETKNRWYECQFMVGSSIYTTSNHGRNSYNFHINDKLEITILKFTALSD